MSEFECPMCSGKPLFEVFIPATVYTAAFRRRLGWILATNNVSPYVAEGILKYFPQDPDEQIVGFVDIKEHSNE